jgi:ketosteroid isomerase-like protein
MAMKGVSTMADKVDNNEPDSEIQVEQKLRQNNREWVEALIDGDTATLNRLMDEGCVFSYVLDGDDRAQFIGDIQSGELKVETLKRDTIEVRVYGSTGVVIAHDEADWEYKGSRIHGHYRTIHVYNYREGHWRIVAIQTSPIPLE